MRSGTPVPRVEAVGISKYFGKVVALENVSIAVDGGQVVCLLGDNGAGKSTLIKILCGYLQPDAGEVRVNGSLVTLDSPRTALSLGIAPVYQDLALFPMMNIVRNFIVGKEVTKGRGIAKRIDWPRARAEAVRELGSIGIRLDDTDQAAGTLSGGERQSLAIARAEHRGASVLILDEPTASLGVKQARNVLVRIAETRRHGVAIILITHSPQHALLVGDRFIVLSHGRVIGDFRRGEVDAARLSDLMAGGADLKNLERELSELDVPGLADPDQIEAARVTSSSPRAS